MKNPPVETGGSNCTTLKYSTKIEIPQAAFVFRPAMRGYLRGFNVHVVSFKDEVKNVP